MQRSVLCVFFFSSVGSEQEVYPVPYLEYVPHINTLYLTHYLQFVEIYVAYTKIKMDHLPYLPLTKNEIIV